MSKYKLVIDIGGTSVKGAIFNGASLSERRSFYSPKSWPEMADNLDSMIKGYLIEHNIEAISFSVPGIANHQTGQIDGASSLHYLHDFPFLQHFEDSYQLPIYFENDANCACHAEVVAGAAKGGRNVIFIIVGTGIGGSIVMNGEFVAGANNFAGEFGMMLMDDANEEWSKTGSAVHMARAYSKAVGQELSGKEVFDRAESGEELALTYVDNLYLNLAKGLYNLQYILDPEYIVVGGGISNKSNLLTKLEEKLEVVMGYGQRCPIKPTIVTSHYKNDANLIGAGLLVDKM
ncbi:ROK family protein [Vagococcus intermedius]|uniref:ROK family protein n=1 Tax=Vagococcus intermedius TaxID=2991418 RepID=A0AAF0CVU1_9ENTE|nr:ROK family protein [Vagococcus intermedius]WEG73960.1 ROK family protein [Vagococcus intermedius]WEG76040.1 ROK family protein [Vagococcus intermedius]